MIGANCPCGKATGPNDASSHHRQLARERRNLHVREFRLDRSIVSWTGNEHYDVRFQDCDLTPKKTCLDAAQSRNLRCLAVPHNRASHVYLEDVRPEARILAAVDGRIERPKSTPER